MKSAGGIKIPKNQNPETLKTPKIKIPKNQNPENSKSRKSKPRKIKIPKNLHTESTLGFPMPDRLDFVFS
jgi:hypothetical protein